MEHASDIVGSLPVPPPDAIAHSRRVVEIIDREIDACGGRISFMRFMELALYAPGLGYYCAGARKFGLEGDFVTAPEISSLFSRCVARQCAQVLQVVKGEILELGAGSGAMAADILLELEALGELPLCYNILELSGDLRERQRAVLSIRAPHLLQRVQWLDSLPRPGFRGVILGNEVLDAMPVQRFRMTEHGLKLLYVARKDGRFVEEEVPASSVAVVEALQSTLGYRFPVGYESEFNPHLSAWLAALGHLLEAGMLLFIDYGYPRHEYYHPQRSVGTLVCHYRHRVHSDPLVFPGLQDITANVDFTAVADAAAMIGLEVAGFTSQAHFLFGCGLEEFFRDHDLGDAASHLELARQTKVLTLPGEMGARYKAIALTAGLDLQLRGFVFCDELARL